MAQHETDLSKLPALGRALTWVDRPGSANKLFWALAIACVALFAADLFYEKHPHFDLERIFGAYALYGFGAFTFIIFAAKTLRVLIKRPEDYYGDTDVNAEDYPADQTEQVRHNGL